MQKDELEKFHLFEYSPIGYLIIDKKGYILQSNIACQKILSSEGFEMKRKNLCSFTLNNIDSDVIHMDLEACVESSKPQEFHFFKEKDHEICTNVIQAAINEEVVHNQFLATLFDMTNFTTSNRSKRS